MPSFTQSKAAETPFAAHLEQFFNLSVDMFCIAGLDGYFKLVNSAWEATLGFTPEEMVSRPFVEFIDPDDVEPTNARYASQVEQGRDVIQFENRYRRKDGSYRWLLWNAKTASDQQLIYAVARDVTDAKRREEDLERKGKARYESRSRPTDVPSGCAYRSEKAFGASEGASLRLASACAEAYTITELGAVPPPPPQQPVYPTAVVNIVCTVSPATFATVVFLPSGSTTYQPGDNGVKITVGPQTANGNVTCTFVNAPNFPSLLGDLTCNGTVDVMDMLKGLKYLAGLNMHAMDSTSERACPMIGDTVLDVADEQMLWGDENCNGMVDTMDTLMELQALAGLPYTTGEFFVSGSARPPTEMRRRVLF